MYFGNVLYFRGKCSTIVAIGVYLAHIYSPRLYSEMSGFPVPVVDM